MTFAMPKVPKGRQANTRPQRWSRACSNGLQAIAYIRENIEDGFEDEFLTEDNQVAMVGSNTEVAKALSVMEDSRDELEGLIQEYQEWKDNISGTPGETGPTADKLDEIVDITIPDLSSATLEDLEEFFNNGEGADLPRGYGKD